MWYRKSMIPAVLAASLLGTGGVVPAAQAQADEQGKGKSAAAAKDSRRQKQESARQAKSPTDKQMKRIQSAVDDAWLDGKLETALLLTDELNSFAIDTEVQDGVAYLSGTVPSDIERGLAGEIAQSISGVDSVNNNLIIDKERAGSAGNSADTAADEQFRNAVDNAVLTARIKSEILLNSGTTGLSIDVTSSQKEVTLDGTVSSQAARELAEQIAQNASGERAVKNKLKVKQSS